MQIERKTKKEQFSEKNIENFNKKFDKKSGDECWLWYGAKHPGGKRGEDHPSHILTWEIVNKIRYRYINENITHKELGKEYNVSRGNITCIINNKIWRNKDIPEVIKFNKAEQERFNYDSN